MVAQALHSAAPAELPVIIDTGGRVDQLQVARTTRLFRVLADLSATTNGVL